MSTIEKTSDYSIFNIHDSNRELKEQRVQALMKSIQEHNVLAAKPIIISSDMSVIDGQHRLEAAKRLGVDIYYIQGGELNSEDMWRLNAAQTGWQRHDYLRFFCNEGHQDYIKLRDYARKRSMSIQQALALLDLPHSGKRSRDFVEGKFKFPEDEVFKAKDLIFEKIQHVKDFIRARKMESCLYLEALNFQGALLRLFVNEEIDLQFLCKRLELRLEMFGQRSTLADYLRLLLNIYNYRNPNPIYDIDA